VLSLSRPLSRRTVQGALAGTLVLPLTGCDLLPGPTPTAPPAPTSDELLVDTVTAQIRTVRGLAAAAPGAQSLVDVHDAHLGALGAPAPSGSTPATPAVPPPTPADLRAAEVALETTLTQAAAGADDGGLARLLASMAASTAQHVAVLSTGKAQR
jgi:hypothetical protein